MMGALLSWILDVAVLISLGVTIFYALKLSKSLNEFRRHRQEFGAIINSLSRNIAEAQKAIEGLKSASREAGRDLQEILDESRVMADELQLINEAGNNLAARLENLAQKNSRKAQGLDFEEDAISKPAAKPLTATRNSDAPSFFIQDRDFGDDDDGASVDHLPSRAEQELYKALQKSGKTGGRAA